VLSRISDFVHGPEGIFRLDAADAASAVRELGFALAPFCNVDGERIVDLLARREHVATTAVGGQVAIPHARTADAAETVGIVGLSARGVDFAAADGLPVQVFVALLSPIHGGRHLQAIASIARDLSDPTFRRRLLKASSPDAAYQLLAGAAAFARR